MNITKEDTTMAETTIPARNETQTEAIAQTRDDSRYIVPPVDIYENEDALVVVADLPGVKKEDLHINVENGVLTIDGHPSSSHDGEMVDAEFELLNFYRQFTLSDKVDQEKIEATLACGVLTLELPKAEMAKPRQIEVKIN